MYVQCKIRVASARDVWDMPRMRQVFIEKTVTSYFTA